MQDDVANGAADTFMDNVDEPTLLLDTLETGTTYYWRVDEIKSGGETVVGDVWSFRTLPVIPVTNPNLVGWWTFDEGEGTQALDWSGHEIHGAFHGAPQWITGADGGALELKGTGDYVDLGNPADWPAGSEPRSMCGWARTDTTVSGFRLSLIHI